MASMGEGLPCVLATLIVAAWPASGDAATCPRGWCGFVDVALVGFNYTVRQAETQGLCHRACAAEPWCRSANYESNTGRCQLVQNASHLDATDRLVPVRGWFYSYIEPEEPPADMPVDHLVDQLADQSVVDQKQETPCVMNDTDISLLIRTKTEYPFGEATTETLEDGCKKYHPGLQLCTLSQLIAAYQAGFVDGSTWSLYAKEGWQAKVRKCLSSHLKDGTCHVVTADNPSVGYVINRERPTSNSLSPAYCCPSNNCSHPIEWQLVFQGPGAVVQRNSNRSLFELWTEPSSESAEDSQNIFRDNAIYDDWNNQRIEVKFVKLSLFHSGETNPVKQLIFSGAQSTTSDWFNTDQILLTPWWEIGSSDLAINGSRLWPKRQFIVGGTSSLCGEDAGWMFVAGSEPACPEIPPFAILYSTTAKTQLWNVELENGRAAMADYLTIHVITE